MVFQNPADQIVASTVEEDIAFGLENLNLPSQIIRERVDEQLALAGLTEEATRPPHLLSGGQMQKVALAGVLARQPEIIVFDEPTAMLDPVAREVFLDRVRELHHQGMTVIYITHHMEETVYADQVCVLNQGKIILQGHPGEVFSQSELTNDAGLEKPEAYALGERFRSLGWEISQEILTPDALIKSLPVYDGSQKAMIYNPKPFSGKQIISLQDVHYTYLSGTPLAKPALNGASVNVLKGNIHALAGTNGSGKSTLLQHINGIFRPDKGLVRVEDLQVDDPKTPLREIIRKVGMVFQNPESQFFEVFVGDEIAYGPKQFNFENIRERVKAAMEMVGLDFEGFKDRRLETLSGGEKRKVALASTLVLQQDILLFDEPTGGMDPGARDSLLDLFKQLNQQGKTIIIASHRLDELAQVSYFLSAMNRGKVIVTQPSQDALSAADTLFQAGLKPPLTVRVTEALIDSGCPLNQEETITPRGLIASLERLNE
jgi:energy-coupling factor transport system ATP-binding protein